MGIAYVSISYQLKRPVSCACLTSFLNHDDDGKTNILEDMELPNTMTLSSLHLCAVQPLLRPPRETPQSALQRIKDQILSIAASTLRKVDLFVLPELAPIGYSEDTFQNYLPGQNNEKAQAIYQEIQESMAQLAQELKCFLSFGTVGRNPPNGFTIQQVVVNPQGEVISRYDKIHLCDYGDCAETRFFRPGSSAPDATAVFEIHGWRLGTIICADMRYPNLARRLVQQHQLDVLLQPAAFSRDLSFWTWGAFRVTRAVENAVYFVGANYAGPDFGETAIVPPWVDHEHVPVVMDCQTGHLAHVLQKKELDQARKQMPFYRHLMVCEGKECCHVAFCGDGTKKDGWNDGHGELGL